VEVPFLTKILLNKTDKIFKLLIYHDNHMYVCVYSTHFLKSDKKKLAYIPKADIANFYISDYLL